MKYKALFHTHPKVIPYFDKNNKRLRKKIRKYILFLKKKGISITDFTWHAELYNRNPKLPKDKISFSRLNLPPLEIFRMFKEEAEKENILAIPCLEVVTLVKTKDKPKKIHMLLMHEKEEELFGKSFLYDSSIFLEDMLKKIPKDFIIIIAHPWRFKYGLAYEMGPDYTNKLSKKEGLLIEKNGWAYPCFYGMSSLIKKIPLLKKSKKVDSMFLDLKKSFSLSGLKKSNLFYGLDIHAPHLLPKDTGFVEFKISKEPNIKHILELIKKSKGKPIMPKNFGFSRSLSWIINDLLNCLAVEIILRKRLEFKN